jgi:hypothetical protein
MYTLNIKLLIVIYLLLALSSAYFAKKSSRNPYLWFGLALLFGIWSLVALLILSFKKKETGKKATPPKNNPHPLLKDSKFWYYLTHENKEVGPMSLCKLHSLYLEGKVSENSYVWNEELANWQTLKTTVPFSRLNQEKGTV